MKKQNISGLVFINYQTPEFLLASGNTRGSTLVLDTKEVTWW